MAGLVGFASCRSGGGGGKGGEVGCCPIKRLATQSLQPWILLFITSTAIISLPHDFLSYYKGLGA